MNTWKFWAGIFLVFAAGVIVGGAGTGLYVRHTVRAIVLDGPQVMNRLLTKKLARELDLTERQEHAVSGIVRETQYRLHELRRRNRPETARILADGVTRMKGELTAEQSEQLEALHATLRDRWAKRDRQFAAER
jgi:hypothetical protein